MGSIRGIFFVLGIVLVLFPSGCKSSGWSPTNPFSHKPKPKLASPAEMESLQLKAPPENYTKENYNRAKENASPNSLVQQGAYQVPSLETVASSNPMSGGASETPRGVSQVAMNPNHSTPSSMAPSASSVGSGGTSPYQNAPTTGYSAPGFNTSPMSDSSPNPLGTLYGDAGPYAPSLTNSAPFAPGSIGGY